MYLRKQLEFVNGEEKESSRLGREGIGMRERGEPRDFISGRGKLSVFSRLVCASI